MNRAKHLALWAGVGTLAVVLSSWLCGIYLSLYSLLVVFAAIFFGIPALDLCVALVIAIGGAVAMAVGGLFLLPLALLDKLGAFEPYVPVPLTPEQIAALPWFEQPGVRHKPNERRYQLRKR